MFSQHQLRVGIDFGTTNSAVAWTHTSKPEEVTILSQWPGRSSRADLVPSEISYTATGEVLAWGFEIKPGRERLGHLQLLLHPSQSSATTEIRKLIPNSKLPVDVVADYLSCLRKHTIETLRRTYGIQFMNVTHVNWVLTLPAVISDVAKALTLQAAESAGFGEKRTQLIPRSEAAMAWTLMRDIQPNTIKLHDAFVIVEGSQNTVQTPGGGDALFIWLPLSMTDYFISLLIIQDLVSYEVVALSPALEVRQCVTGTGGLCGYNFISQCFEDFVKLRMGRGFDKMKSKARSIMLKHFDDTHLRSFTNSENEEFYSCPALGVPDHPANGIEEGLLLLTRKDMRSIFDPTIEKIIPLVQEQINSVEGQKLHLSAVISVGDFGASMYLRRRLETELRRAGRSGHPDIDILQPINSLTAAARGAALGIQILRRTVRAKQYYGIESDRQFIFGKDPLDNLSYCQYTGRALCRRHIEWFIKQGDQIPENIPITITSCRRVGLNDEMLFTNDLFIWEQSPPEYSNQLSNSIKTLCKLTADLRAVPINLFAKQAGPTTAPHYEVNYILSATVQSDKIVFELVFQGKVYGVAEAEMNVL